MSWLSDAKRQSPVSAVHGLLAAFGEHFVKPGLVEPRYGRILHDAFEARLDSDYAPHPKLTEASGTQVVAEAEDFVQPITKLLSELRNTNEGDDNGE